MRPIPKTAFIPGPTVPETILNCCREHKEKTALICQNSAPSEFKFKDVERIVTGAAGNLKNRGFKRGERAGILSENRPEWGLSYLAVLAAGGTVVPLDSSWKEQELLRTIRCSGVTTVFTTAKWYPFLRELNLAENKPLEIIGLDDIITPNLLTISSGPPYLASNINGKDIAALIYTSGTTGEPKGVMLTHRNLVANLEGIIAALDFYPDDLFLSVLPLHHTFEATCGMLTPLSLGLTVAYARSLKSRDIIDDIARHRVTCMVAVPLLFEKIYLSITRKIEELPFPKRLALKTLYGASNVGWNLGVKAGRLLFKGLRHQAGLSSIRLFVSGGAPLPAEIARWFNLIGFDFLEGYGLSECAPVVAVNRPQNIKFGSVGPPLPNIDVRIIEPSRDGVGEIAVKGENITAGYLNNPQATDDLIREGWLYTGDLGRMKDGYLFITGRKKNLIVSAAGKNIYPEEIEAELMLSPYIREALVLGRKRNGKMEEEVCGIILPDMEQISHHPLATSGGSDDNLLRRIIKEEVEAVNDRLADYKRLSQFEIRLEEFEKTSTRKIKRNLYSWNEQRESGEKDNALQGDRTGRK